MHSSDFAEAGEEGRILQQELTAILAEGRVPLVGPNSMGIVAPADGLAASISGGLEMTELTAGRVGLLTSSGALGSCIATRLMGAGIGLSKWVHVGNEADLVIADFLDWLVDDPQTKTIGLLLEDIKDGPRLVEAGRRLAAAGKPTFAYNMGRSERGRRSCPQPYRCDACVLRTARSDHPGRRDREPALASGPRGCVDALLRL